MTKPRTLPVRPVDPLGTLPLFILDADDRQFRCGICNDLAVDEPGELCATCASRVLTKPRTRKTPTRRAPARKPTARKTSKAGESR